MGCNEIWYIHDRHSLFPVAEYWLRCDCVAMLALAQSRFLCVCVITILCSILHGTGVVQHQFHWNHRLQLQISLIKKPSTRGKRSNQWNRHMQWLVWNEKMSTFQWFMIQIYCRRFARTVSKRCYPSTKKILNSSYLHLLGLICHKSILM